MVKSPAKANQFMQILEQSAASTIPVQSDICLRGLLFAICSLSAMSLTVGGMLEFQSNQIQQITRQVCNYTTSQQSVGIGLLCKGNWLNLCSIDLTWPRWCIVVLQKPRPPQLWDVWFCQVLSVLPLHTGAAALSVHASPAAAMTGRLQLRCLQ